MIPIFSSGNFGRGNDPYLGPQVFYRLPWALIVGASNINDEWAGSNYGEGLDIVAPGANYMIGSAFSETPPILSDPSLAMNKDQDNYSWVTLSTSNAGPIVNGAASLMLGYAREKLSNKYFTNEDVMNILRLSADKVHDQKSLNTPYTVTKNNQPIVAKYDYKIGGSARTAYLQDGWDPYMGHGRLNVCKALWYQRDGFLRHYTTAYNESLFEMPVTVTGVISQPLTVNEITEKSSITAVPNTFKPVEYEDFQLRQVKVQKKILFSALSPVPSLSTFATVKVWGTGSKMSNNGFAALFVRQALDGIVTTLYDGGWCQPTTGTVSNSGATLETYVYQVVSARKKSTGNIETFTDVWLPCKPQDVVFKYTVFGIPAGQSPCEESSTFAVNKDSYLNSERALHSRSDEESFEQIHEVELLQNTPNPFSGETGVEFLLPETATVRLEVVDMLGRQVIEPIVGTFGGGKRSLVLNLQHLTNGVYSARLTAMLPSGTITRKAIRMVLLK